MRIAKHTIPKHEIARFAAAKSAFQPKIVGEKLITSELSGRTNALMTKKTHHGFTSAGRERRISGATAVR